MSEQFASVEPELFRLEAIVAGRDQVDEQDERAEVRRRVAAVETRRDEKEWTALECSARGLSDPKGGGRVTVPCQRTFEQTTPAFECAPAHQDLVPQFAVQRRRFEWLLLRTDTRRPVELTGAVDENVPMKVRDRIEQEGPQRGGGL